MLSEPVLVVAELARVFDALGIRYVVGGSVASSLYGIPRATQDVDLQVSDRQWGDILGVLKVQGDALDHAYLDQWAPLLDVFSLLVRARKEQKAK